VTQYGPEGFAAMGVDTGWGDGMFGSEIGDAFPLIAINANVMGMVNIVAAASSTAFAATNQQALLGAYGTIGPVSFEGGWTLSGDSMGYIPLGVKFSSAMDPVSVSAMASYVLALDSAKYSNWSAGAAVTFAGSYTVDFAMLSYQPSYEPTVTALKGTGDVIVNITKTLGVIGSVYLNFDPNAAAAFDTVEVSAWTLFGPAKVRLGYLYGATGTDNLGTPNLNAPSNNGGKGGIFLTTDLAF